MSSEGFSFQVHEDGVLLTLAHDVRGFFGLRSRGDKVVPLDDWGEEGNGRLIAAIAALELFDDDHPGQMRNDDGSLWISHGAVAALSNRNAEALG